ncbi:ABC transporter substrate-binding protein [Nonomuraea sp. CA-141351]|uniref:ABC transporter substrate-binding protein n=1 Tax=Nonomuraea sp. CA-141351 TaxID=3239996 RepID=UPI003D91F3A5
MARPLNTLAGLSTALVVLTGCSFDSGSADAPAGGKSKLVVADLWAPDSGYALETDDAFTLTRAGCLETLVAVDKNNQAQPALATEWKQTAPKSWTFTIRETKFQNGTALTAKVVADDLNRLLKATAPPRSFSPSVISTVTAADDRTVRIDTPDEDLFLPLRVSVPNTGILAPEAFSGTTTNPVGTCTGPFEITSTGTGQSLSLTANDDYWGGDVALGSAEIRYTESDSTRVTQLRTGEVSVAANLPVTSLTTLKGDDSITLQQASLPRTTGLYLNTRKAPFDNVEARRAIQKAIGLDAIVKGVYEGTATAAAGPFTPDEPWTPDGLQPVQGDASAAKAVMAAAGIDPGSLGFELIAYSDRPEFADLAQVIQAQLAEAGITVKIRTGDYASVEDDLMGGKFQATLLSRNHLIDLPEPISILRSDETCKGGFNLAGYCNPQVDALVKKAGTTADTTKRHALYGQIATHLATDVAFIPLVHESLTMGVADTVQGLPTDPLERTLLTKDTKLS